ncbi:MAG: PAS domain-containing protein, partial [Syntrophus sp. (in: bacteria)]
MKKPLRVLMVEDSEDDTLLEIRALKNGGYDPEYERVETAGAMRTALREKTWDIILCDYQMPKFNGLAAIALLKETGIDIPMIIVSGAIGEETAADCMRHGAHDYIMKGNLSRLVPAIKRELQEAESRRKRRQVEELLLQRNRRLDLAQSVAKAGVWDWDIVTGHIEWSDHLFNLFGFDPQKTTASFEAWGSVIHPEDAEIAGQRIDKALKERTQLNSDYRIILPGGTIHWVNAVGEGEYDDQGRPVRMIGICLDITDRKLAEEALKETERLKSELLDKMNEAQHVAVIGSWEWDFKTNHIWWSDETYRIFDVSPQDFVPSFEANGKFIHPDDFAKYCKSFEHSIQTRKPLTDDFRLVTNHGHLKHSHAEGICHYDDSGQPIRFIGTIMDITERKQAEQALRKSEEHLKEAQRVAHLGSWDLNVVTGDLQWSDECYHIYGFRPQEFVPTYEKFRSIVHPEDLGFVQEQVDAAVNDDKHYDVDFRFVKPNGEVGWLHCDGEVMRDAEGKPLRFFGTQIDISERKKTEEKIREITERLELATVSAKAGVWDWNLQTNE